VYASYSSRQTRSPSVAATIAYMTFEANKGRMSDRTLAVVEPVAASPNATVLKGDPVDAVAKLKQELDGRSSSRPASGSYTR
jgi:hypothetical protein